MTSLDAFRIHRDADPFVAGLESMPLDALTAGDVVVDVLYSSVNYKDALAGTNRGRILKAPVLNGGIDLAGRVLSSESPAFAVGDEVFCCGAGLSEHRDGGYATRARLPASCLMRPPAGLSLRDTMAIGTAGITAMIAVQRMQDNGQPSDHGPILVTGASGGVGSFAVHLLARSDLGVTASTGKPSAREYLTTLGAAEVIGRIDADTPPRALDEGRWGGAVDSLGGVPLARIASSTRAWGSIACIGLAAGAALDTSVMPLILRGVSLLGINGIECPPSVLERAWTRIATLVEPATLARIAPHETTLAGLPEVFERILAGEVTGRTVVVVQSPDT